MNQPKITEIQPKGELTKDVRALLDEVFDDKKITTDATRKELLLQNFVIYIVTRDHKVMTHGVNVGKKLHDRT
jgi:hypothetical protein